MDNKEKQIIKKSSQEDLEKWKGKKRENITSLYGFKTSIKSRHLPDLKKFGEETTLLRETDSFSSQYFSL